MIFAYALVAAFVAGCLSRWALGAHEYALRSFVQSERAPRAVVRMLLQLSSSAAFLLIFWTPIFARFDALRHDGGLAPVFTYALTFLAVLGLALHLYPVRRSAIRHAQGRPQAQSAGFPYLRLCAVALFVLAAIAAATFLR